MPRPSASPPPTRSCNSALRTVPPATARTSTRFRLMAVPPWCIRRPPAGHFSAVQMCRPISLPLLLLQRHGIELQPVIDQPIAEPARDLRLQPLDLLRLELDHLAGPQVD